MKPAEVLEFVFDSHRFVKRLTRAGMDERVAEVLADEQVALLTGNLATRTALADTEAGLRTDLKATEIEIRSDVERRLAEARADLMKWMFVGALIAQAALIVTLIKLLP